MQAPSLPDADGTLAADGDVATAIAAGRTTGEQIQSARNDINTELAAVEMTLQEIATAADTDSNDGDVIDAVDAQSIADADARTGDAIRQIKNGEDTLTLLRMLDNDADLLPADRVYEVGKALDDVQQFAFAQQWYQLAAEINPRQINLDDGFALSKTQLMRLKAHLDAAAASGRPADIAKMLQDAYDTHPRADMAAMAAKAYVDAGDTANATAMYRKALQQVELSSDSHDAAIAEVATQYLREKNLPLTPPYSYARGVRADYTK